MTNHDKAYWEDQYHTQNKSLAMLAEENNTYVNKIRRILIGLGIRLKTKSEAQSSALALGRHSHPTKGKERPVEVKERIGNTLADQWKNKTDEERLAKTELAKSQWAAISDEERARLQTKAAKAVRKTSVEGSALERYILGQLEIHGYQTRFHVSDLIANDKLQVDLYIPSCLTAIEIDGPTHFLPIWGEENLAKHQAADAQKNALLALSGYNIIRVMHLSKTISDTYKRRVFEKVLAEVERIQANSPLPVEGRVITIKEDDYVRRNR